MYFETFRLNCTNVKEFFRLQIYVYFIQLLILILYSLMFPICQFIVDNF